MNSITYQPDTRADNKIRLIIAINLRLDAGPCYCASEKFTGTSAREVTGRPATRAGSNVQRWTPWTAALSSAGNPELCFTLTLTTRPSAPTCTSSNTRPGRTDAPRQDTAASDC